MGKKIEQFFGLLTILLVISLPVLGDSSPLKSLLGIEDEITDPIPLSEGSLIFTLQHTGDANFIVWLLNCDGDRLELIVNEIGIYSGSRAIQIPISGDYYLEIHADGMWSVKISQPLISQTEDFSQISGSGPMGTSLYYFDRGLAKFEMKFSGDGNFIVWLLDEYGNKVELLANEIGSFSGSTGAKIPSDGRYMLDIQADGNWAISLK